MLDRPSHAKSFDFFYDIGYPYSISFHAARRDFEQRTGSRARTLTITLGGCAMAPASTSASPAAQVHERRTLALGGAIRREHQIRSRFRSAPSRPCRAPRGEDREEKGEGRAMNSPVRGTTGARLGGTTLDCVVIRRRPSPGPPLDGKACSRQPQKQEIKRHPAAKERTQTGREPRRTRVPTLFVGESSFWERPRSTSPKRSCAAA